MANINLSGQAQNFVRVAVPDDVYEATLVAIDPNIAVVNGKFGEKKRMIVRWKLPLGEEVPQFLNPDVRKGSGNFQNTSSYNLLEKGGMLDGFRNYVGLKTEIQDSEVAGFLGKLVGRAARIMVQTVRPQNGEPYSVVKEVVRFL